MMSMRVLTALDVEDLFRKYTDLRLSVFNPRNNLVIVSHMSCGVTEDFILQDLMMSDIDFINNRVLPFLKQCDDSIKAGRDLKPDTSALKNDQDKDPWHLAPWDAFRCIVKVIGFGSKKYAPRNWEKGFDVERLYRASIEHLVSWWECEDKGKGPGIDSETGCSHLWHAGCCVVFLIAHELRGIGKDSRPNKKD